MTVDRSKLCALAAAIAASLAGGAFAQTAGSAPGIATPAPAGTPALTRGTSEQAPAGTARPRSDPAAIPRAPASTQPSAGKGLATGSQAAADANAKAGAATTSTLPAGGVPSMSGVTPNRAELPASAFTKLDGANRGYVTFDDVRQLEGFESAFRQADQNGDGRLNASEFNSAWAIYTGNVR